MRYALLLILALAAPLNAAETFRANRAYGVVTTNVQDAEITVEVLRHEITQQAMELIENKVLTYQQLKPYEQKFHAAGRFGQIANIYKHQAEMLAITATSDDDYLDAIKLSLRAIRSRNLERDELLRVKLGIHDLVPKPEPVPEPVPDDEVEPEIIVN